MEKTEMIVMCNNFFHELVALLDSKYELVQSCNGDFSRYLVPIGTADQITYHSKPDNSFRISDHWSWYANIKKCSDPKYIQCLNADLPWVQPRQDDKPTRPIIAYQVALIGPDGKYHAVYGEIYNKNRHQWLWKEANPYDVVKRLLEGGD